jgi:hypothetical protein
MLPPSGAYPGLSGRKKPILARFWHLIVFGGARWDENRAGTGDANKK